MLPSNRSALKHVKRRHYFIRDMVDADEVRVVRVRTNDNVADLLTKPLARERFRMLAALMRRGWSVVRG